jgi:formylmethanofuran dehydrogenase subunit C
MTLTLSYRGETSVPVEIEGLTPDWACDKSLAEIETFPIYHGNRRIPLADLFSVSGDAGDKHVLFEGNLAGVHWIGAHMSSGRIDIHGPAGRHVGSDLRGGEIHVHGNAGGWVGAEMRNGFIHVHGNAGHLVGAAYRGSARGMTGGTILVDGNAGNEIGLTMRRGLVAVGGTVGDLLGFNMIAGTVLVFGGCGIRPGAGMRRGMLGLFGESPPPLLPSFRFTATHRPQIVSVLLRDVRSKGLKLDESLWTAEFDFYQGDLVSVGRGEILFRHQG